MFLIKPDLHVAANGEEYIADTKYKLIYPDKDNLKDCISAPDIYQMISYAVRLGINTVKLLYPSHYAKKQNGLTSGKQKVHNIKVKNTLCKDTTINIAIHMINIINNQLLTQTTSDIQGKTIQKHFDDTKELLIVEFKEIFNI